MRAKKRGILFTMDALFASMLLIAALILLIDSSYTNTIDTDRISYASNDIMNAFSNIRMEELNNTYIKNLIAAGVINNTGNTIIEQIGEFYVLNKSGYALNISKELSEKLIPNAYGFSIIVNDETVFENSIPLSSDLITSRRLISGIEKFKPIRGATSKVYLEGLQKKKDSSYIFFGGFIGQGNISKFDEKIPTDANITQIYMELEAADSIGDEFTVFFNGVQCLGTFNRTSEPMSADSWDLSSCKESIVPGTRNNVSIIFVPHTNYDIAYISGGFIRFDYFTEEMYQEETEGYRKYNFPSIDGIINLYSSFYIPGNITSMKVCMNYLVNHSESNSTFYLKIGNNTIVYDENSTTVQNICIENETLINDKNLNYSDLNNKNIPVRMGAENVSYFTEYVGNADAVLITDVSGSMGWDMSGSSGTSRDCSSSNFNDSDTSRLSIAKCLDKNFVHDMLNISGNMIGLTSYESSTDSNHGLSDDIPSIESEINSYSAGGGTCICCGIYDAISLLSSSLSYSTLISANSEWLYDDTNLRSEPSPDLSANEWYEFGYDDSGWSSGSSILGATNGYFYDPLVNTELLASPEMIIPLYYPDFWENLGDSSGPPADFSSSTLNSTANTWGLNAGYDGWDTIDSWVFDYGSDTATLDFYNQRLRIRADSGSDDTSGAYGIEINITQEMFDAIDLSEGNAVLSFDWWWDDRGSFSSYYSHIWIKSYWHSPYSGINYLGEDLDAWDSEADAYFEIYEDDDPDGDASDSEEFDISDWIEGPGIYYFAIGGKLRRSDSNDDGWFMFDNIQIKITGQANSVKYLDLWEHSLDNSGFKNDFSGGTLNSTSDTFGLGGGDDGWDSSASTYSSSGTGVSFNGITNNNGNNMLEIYIDGNSGPLASDGAYGIEFYVNQSEYDTIKTGYARFTMYYEWSDDSGAGFDATGSSSDEVWIKARITNTTGNVFYLGTDLDSGHSDSDATVEVDNREDPDVAFSNTVTYDITEYITEPGYYYLDFGGKLHRTGSGESGRFYFDDIAIEYSNSSDNYYFRKNFSINDLSIHKNLYMNILSDDYAEVYLNGNLVYSDSQDHEASYWNANAVDINTDYLRTGNNEIAVALTNSQESAKFDLEIFSTNSSRTKAIILMTDGEATTSCGVVSEDLDGNGIANEPEDDAIHAACEASSEYGFMVFAVGVSEDPDIDTLKGVASCGNGKYMKSDNTTILDEFYKDIASEIMDVSRVEQKIVVSGVPTVSTLFGENSFIEINYTSTSSTPEFGDISVKFEEELTNNCTFLVNISPKIEVSDAKVTSYSSSKWTDFLYVNNQAVYNLSFFNEQYEFLGDPFVVNFDPNLINQGSIDNITIRTGIEASNSTGCSKNSTFIYTGLLKATVSYSDVLESFEGCEWNLEFEDSTTLSLMVPPDYLGSNQCYYTSSNIDYNINDTYDDAVYKLMAQLDLDDDGLIDVNLAENDLVINAISIKKVPYPWGPTIAEVRIWR